MDKQQLIDEMIILIKEKITDQSLRQRLIDEARKHHIKFVLAQLDEYGIEDFDDHQQEIVKEAFFLWG